MSISKAVRDAIRARLADPAEGFTATHTALAADYGVAPISIDFSGAAAVKQFFEGNIDLDDVAGSTATKRPLCKLYTERSRNTGECLRGVFSGLITAVFVIRIEQKSGNAVRDYEAPADAVEETLHRVLNARVPFSPLSYGGDAEVIKGPVVPGDVNWRQDIMVRVVLGAHVTE